jgi:hypothetical protein
VPSVDRSSTTTSSKSVTGTSSASTSSIARAIVALSLYTGMSTDSAAGATRGRSYAAAPTSAWRTTSVTCAASAAPSTGLMGIARFVRAAASVAGSSTPPPHGVIAG